LHSLCSCHCSIPTLAVVWLVALLRGSRIVIDWHNLGFTVLACSLGEDHVFVKVRCAFHGRRAVLIMCSSGRQAVRAYFLQGKGERGMRVFFQHSFVLRTMVTALDIKIATHNFCVTKAMKGWLESNWGIRFPMRTVMPLATNSLTTCVQGVSSVRQTPRFLPSFNT
jgi:hypothetical protein